MSHPTSREITNYYKLPGEIQAVQSVDVKARVRGYLEEIKFTSGSEVKKGAVLFVLDKRPFQAKADQAKATVAQTEAQRKLAHIEYQRNLKIQKDNPAAIAQVTVDRSEANVGVQDANVLEANAALADAQLNLEYCTVTSPMDGRISRNFVSVGDLVIGGTPDATKLTTIVSVDPMYAYFDADERTIERMLKLADEGTIGRNEAGHIPVEMGLAVDEGQYPHAGAIDFIDNQIDPQTGTLEIRGVFPNPKLANGERMLLQGMFARIRVPATPPHKALLVTERAVAADMAGPYVAVVNAENIVERRRVKLGEVLDGMQVIEEGIAPDDRIVVNGILNARPGRKVDVRQLEPDAKRTADTSSVHVPAAQDATNSAAGTSSPISTEH